MLIKRSKNYARRLLKAFGSVTLCLNIFSTDAMAGQCISIVVVTKNL